MLPEIGDFAGLAEGVLDLAQGQYSQAAWDGGAALASTIGMGAVVRVAQRASIAGDALKATGALRRASTFGDIEHVSEAAARRTAMRTYDVATSVPNNFERVLVYGKNPNLRGPNGEPGEIIKALDMDGNTVEIQHHQFGHVFPDGTFEKPHYHGPNGEHYTY